MTSKLRPNKLRSETNPKPPGPSTLLKKERGVWVYLGKPTEASVPAVNTGVRMNRLRALAEQ